jgi:hypothetical protein
MTQKLSVAELIEQTVLEGKGRIVSTADLMFLVRAALPECEHDDEELTQLIAAIAIRNGCNISFGTHPGAELFPFEGRPVNEPRGARYDASPSADDGFPVGRRATG